MGCEMSKQQSGSETLEASARPAIRVYGPTNFRREDSILFEEDMWREYYNRQALKNSRRGRR